MSDLFENPIDKIKFKSTNEIWNKLKLNTSWSVGYVSELIKQKKFKNKEEWKQFYFESGNIRQKELSKLSEIEIHSLNSLTGRGSYKGIHSKLNYEYGRTKQEICQKGIFLYNKICEVGNPNNLTKEECMLIVYYRVIGETWNGIIVRENNTKEYVENYFKNQGVNIRLIDTFGDFDYAYGVDFEVYHQGNIKCGLQVKPKSYKSSNTYVDGAKNINHVKNAKYKELFNRDVVYVYAENSGLCNKESLDSINSILNNQ